MKQVVIYARVSSKEQEKGFSIPAQIEFLQEYANKKLFNVVKVFQESETAKKAGRKAFNEMLSFLKENSINTVLVEKTDRLYRNFKDYVLLEDYDLEIHLAKEGTILSKNSKSHDKLIHGFKVLMAKNYIDNLSEEIRKGLAEKVKQGGYPQKAPVGYKNIRVGGRAEIIVDEEKKPFIQRLFELYSTGLSAAQVRKILFEEGLYNNNKPYAKSRLVEILHDPFYIGKFLYKGIVYEGKHEPIISVDLYNKVQKMFNASRTRTHDVQFDYIGLLKCGHCGCQLTAELKKGKYIYYHCTGKRGGSCKKDYIRQEEIDKVLAELIEKIANAIPEHVEEDLKAAIKEMQRLKYDFEDISQENITKKINTLSRRIDALYSDKLDGKISEEFWESKNIEWHREKDTLLNKLQSLNNSSKTFYEGSNLLLKFCKTAPVKFLNASPEVKQQILRLIGSNFTYKDKELSIVLSSVFDLILNFDFSNNGGVDRSKLELFITQLKDKFTSDLLVDLQLAA